MCLNTQTRFTNAHYLSKVHYKNFLVNYPCGRCAECRQAKKSEWRMRAYYELKQLESFGCQSKALKSKAFKPFMLFDTLTYSDEHLVYISDHFDFAKKTCFDLMCFSRSDLKKFFKRLRINLERAGYDVKDNLRYFVTSEYGEDKGRPHYHILFFVYFDIKPLDFSRFVSLAWRCGKTDGVAPSCEMCPVKKYCNNCCIYQSSNYVLNKRVFYGADGYAMNIASYVAKYVTKDIEFDSLLQSKLRHIFNIKYPKFDWRSDFDCWSEYKSVYRQCCNFHQQSKGFGLFALQCNKVEDIVKCNSFPISVTSEKVVVNIPLSQYFKRKLFQEKVNYHGKDFWVYNSLGRKYCLERFRVSRQNMINRLLALPVVVESSGLFKTDVVKKYVGELLDGRSVSDYVDYCLCVRGRVRFAMDIECDKKLSVVESVSYDSNNFDWLRQIHELVYPLNHYVDCRKYHGSFVSFNEVFDGSFISCLDKVSSDKFFKDFCYNQSSSYDYRYFDELFDIICFIQRYIGQKKDYYMKMNELEYKRFKELGFLNKI